MYALIKMEIDIVIASFSICHLPKAKVSYTSDNDIYLSDVKAINKMAAGLSMGQHHLNGIVTKIDFRSRMDIVC